jgi:hypothetical protein
VSSLTRTLTKVRALDVVVGDQVNLGHQWRRVAFVEHHLDVPTDDDINQLIVNVVNAHNGGQGRDHLRRAAHALYVKLDRLDRWHEPYVLVKGGSATSLYEKRFHPDDLVDIVTREAVT